MALLIIQANRTGIFCFFVSSGGGKGTETGYFDGRFCKCDLWNMLDYRNSRLYVKPI